MLTSQEIITTLKSAKPLLEEKYSVKTLALFGSYSRNEASASSDVDILVAFSKNIGILYVDLADELELILHQKVDLVSANAIKAKYFDAIKPDLIYV